MDGSQDLAPRSCVDRDCVDQETGGARAGRASYGRGARVVENTGTAWARQPRGRLGVNPSDLRSPSGLGDCTERAGLLLLCIEVQVCHGDRLPEAQHHRRKQGPALQLALEIEWRARHPFRFFEVGDPTDVPAHGERLHRYARARAGFVEAIADVVLICPHVPGRGSTTEAPCAVAVTALTL